MGISLEPNENMARCFSRKRLLLSHRLSAFNWFLLSGRRARNNQCGEDKPMPKSHSEDALESSCNH